MDIDQSSHITLHPVKAIVDLESEITEEKRRCNETLSTYQQQAARAEAFKREADDAAKEKPMLAGIGESSRK